MKKELCPGCAREAAPHPQERLVAWLLGKLALQDNGCQLGRHDLLNHEWLWLGIVKEERLAVWKEEHPPGKSG